PQRCQPHVRWEASRQPQTQQKQQTQGGEAAQQVCRDHLGPELQGDGPHAEQGLADDQRQQTQGQFQRVAVPAAPLQRQQGQTQYGQAQQAGGVAVNHLCPGLEAFHWCLGKAQLG